MSAVSMLVYNRAKSHESNGGGAGLCCAYCMFQTCSKGMSSAVFFKTQLQAVHAAEMPMLVALPQTAGQCQG